MIEKDLKVLVKSGSENQKLIRDGYTMDSGLSRMVVDDHGHEVKALQGFGLKVIETGVLSLGMTH